jgi:uncharacterized membrane protein YdjX (TVP38/TMEM64 family)
LDATTDADEDEPRFVPLEETAAVAAGDDDDDYDDKKLSSDDESSVKSGGSNSRKKKKKKSRRRRTASSLQASAAAMLHQLADEIQSNETLSNLAESVGAFAARAKAILPEPVARIKCSGKKVVSGMMIGLIVLVVFDSQKSPEDRWIRPDQTEKLLRWVQAHPAAGLIWILLFMSVAVIFMVPIGTPITVGCGYIYKGAYGWKLGVALATVVSMAGSALGAVVCFLLGRYLMREQVRKWIRKYPLFDAIDIGTCRGTRRQSRFPVVWSSGGEVSHRYYLVTFVVVSRSTASAEHGLRIMAMLYLTPILPLGPVSYMCGTTSMTLSSFVLAKVAALPLMMLYVFIGASTGTLMGDGGGKREPQQQQAIMSAEEMKNIEDNETLIVSGILLSFVMIACITHYIKKELNKILEKQKKAEDSGTVVSNGTASTTVETEEATEQDAVEMGQARRAARQRIKQ